MFVMIVDRAFPFYILYTRTFITIPLPPSRISPSNMHSPRRRVTDLIHNIPPIDPIRAVPPPAHTFDTTPRPTRCATSPYVIHRQQHFSELQTRCCACVMHEMPRWWRTGGWLVPRLGVSDGFDPKVRFQGLRGSGDFGLLGVNGFEVWYSRSGLSFETLFSWYRGGWVKGWRWCHVLRKCPLAERYWLREGQGIVYILKQATCFVFSLSSLCMAWSCTVGNGGAGSEFGRWIFLACYDWFCSRL